MKDDYLVSEDQIDPNAPGLQLPVGKSVASVENSTEDNVILNSPLNEPDTQELADLHGELSKYGALPQKGSLSPQDASEMASLQKELSGYGLIKDPTTDAPKPNASKGYLQEAEDSTAKGFGDLANTVENAIPGLTKGLINQAAHSMGFNAGLDTKTNLQNFDEVSKKLQEKYGPGKTLSDLKSDPLGFAIDALGSNVAGIGSTLGAGALAGFATRQAVKQIAKTAGEDLTDAAAKRAVESLAAASAGKASNMAMAGSMGATGAADQYMDWLQKGTDNPAAAVVVGGLNAAIMQHGLSDTLEKIVGPSADKILTGAFLDKMGAPEWAQKVMTGGVQGAKNFAGANLATYTLSTIADKLVAEPNKDLLTSENLYGAVDQVLKGAVAGFVGGGMGHALLGASPGEKLNKLTGALSKPPSEAELKEATSKLNVEPVEKPSSDSSVIHPAFMKPEDEKTADDLGINKDSTVHVHPDVNFAQEITSLKDKLDKGETNIDNLRDTQLPTSDIHVEDSTNLHRPPMEQPATRNPFSLPPSLGKPKPRFKTSEINFPSDVEKAIYITGNAATKSKADGGYRKWLNTSVGLSDKEILQHYQAIKDHLKQGADHVEDGDKLNAPQIDIGQYDKKNLSLSDLGEIEGAKQASLQAMPSEVSSLEDISKRRNNLGFKSINDLGKSLKEMSDKDFFKLTSTLPPEDYSTLNKFRNTDNKTPKFQYAVPKEGSLEHAYIFPKTLVNNIETTPLTERAAKDNDNLIRNFHRIFSKTAPEGAKLLPFETIRDMKNNIPAYGASWRNTLALAFGHDKPQQMPESFWHEMYHTLEGMHFLDHLKTPELTMKLISYLSKDPYLKTIPWEKLMETEHGRAEIRANAFGKRVMEMEGTKDLTRWKMNPDGSLPNVFQRAYNRIWDSLRQFKQALRGMGYNDYDSMVRSIYHGELGGKEPLDVVKEMNHVQQVARLQAMSDEVQQEAADKFKLPEDFDDRSTQLFKMQQDSTSADGNWDEQGLFGKYRSWMASAAHLAKSVPMMSGIFNTFRDMITHQDDLMKGYVDLMPNFLKSGKAARHITHELMNFARNTGQKAKLDSEGYLRLKTKPTDSLDRIRNIIGDKVQPGDEIKIKDKDFSRNYTELQNAYGKQLKDWEQYQRQSLNRLYPDALPENFSLKQLEDFIGTLHPERDLEEKESLSESLENLQDIKKMQKQDYVPHTRYGRWGIKVQDKDGNLVDLLTVENGHTIAGQKVDTLGLKENRGMNTLSKYQLQKAMDKIQKHYSDTSKYDIIGGSGKITDFNKLENLKPFQMNYNDLKNQIDPRFINMEMLSGVRHSIGLDAKDLETMYNKIQENVVKRGYMHRFANSKDVGIGYSDDWDRVMHSSFTGSSHFFSRTPAAVELARWRTLAGKLTDESLKKYILGTDRSTGYIDYVSSPQEDFQSLRSANFMWAMGGNISTAMLQFYTLPTATLGELNKYDPNPIKNMGEITKATHVAMKYFLHTPKKTIVGNDGRAYLDFADEAAHARAVKDGALTQQESDFIKKIAPSTLQGLTPTMTGTPHYETQSFGGDLKNKLSRAGYYLGLPTAMSEQITRAATTLSAFRTLNRPDAQARAENILSKDLKFQNAVAANPELSFAHQAALHTMDNAHAVFGKHGRSPVLRGLGGALFLPFTTYQHQMFENIANMYQSGKDGKRALAYSLGAMMFFGGITGLPASQLVELALNKAIKGFTHKDIDIEELIRDAVYNRTGSSSLATFSTQGILNLMGVDAAPRIGYQYPGTNMLASAAGANGSYGSYGGVAGDVISNISNAISNYNDDRNQTNLLASMLPTSAGNLLKGIDMYRNGVLSGGKQPHQLLVPPGTPGVGPERTVSAVDAFTKGFGVTSSKLWEARTLFQNSKINPVQEYKDAKTMYQQRAINNKAASLQAQQKGDKINAEKHWAKYQQAIKDYRDFMQKNGQRLDIPAVNKAVNLATQQRLQAGVLSKQLTKQVRPQYSSIYKEIYGKEPNQ